MKAIPLMSLLTAVLSLTPYEQALADQICICGFNAQAYCDGSWEHYVPECYTVQNNPCGYDDQIIGSCSNATAPQKLDKIRIR
jgi:hypothetical protein